MQLECLRISIRKSCNKFTLSFIPNGRRPFFKLSGFRCKQFNM